MQDSVADSNVEILEQPGRSLAGTGEPRTEGGADGMLERVLLYSVCVAESLTNRENEILQLIIRGFSNKQTARILSRSERTVEYHRNRLMRKMGVRNAAALVKRAMTMGLG